MEKQKSRVLIVGATGKLGHELAKASLNFSHPTFALVRDSAFADPTKLAKLQSLSDAGVTLLKVFAFFNLCCTCFAWSILDFFPLLGVSGFVAR